MFLGPWSEMHRLNLGWFIAEWNKFYAEWQSTLQAITGALTGEIERVEAAMTDLYAARDAAAASATAANSSALNASASSLAAMDARDAAVSAKNTAQSAASSATASETAAGNSATLASNKATQAGNSATQAGNSAGAAASSASNAAGSATAAGNSATAAGNSATAAGNSATAAASSAAAAEASAQRAEQAAEQAGNIINSVENVSVASVDDAIAENIVKLIVDIDPIQEGTGDPAPDNVRAITGWTGANIYQSGANISNPSIIPITFPAAAGTVYGGYLTFNENGSGKLTVNRAFVSKLWSELTSPTVYTNTTRKLYTKPAGNSGNTERETISNIGKDVGGTSEDFPHITTYSNGTNIYVFMPNGTPESTVIELCYLIGTPVEIELTPTQITMLAGINNIWANTGNINLLKYYGNIKTYIDKQDAVIKALIAKELNNMTADTALTVNDFRIVNNTLYRITSPVASGATLTPGTNCEATTVAAVLKTLLT